MARVFSCLCSPPCTQQLPPICRRLHCRAVARVFIFSAFTCPRASGAVYLRPHPLWFVFAVRLPRCTSTSAPAPGRPGRMYVPADQAPPAPFAVPYARSTRVAPAPRLHRPSPTPFDPPPRCSSTRRGLRAGAWALRTPRHASPCWPSAYGAFRTPAHHRSVCTFHHSVHLAGAPAPATTMTRFS